jgi:hypothetical protein
MLDGELLDLEKGDVFRPVRYVMTSYIASTYAHGVEENSEFFHSAANEYGRQVRPPTAIHMEKMRLLEENTKRGATARAHYEYHCQNYDVAFVGEELVITGHILDRYEKRGRPYLQYEIEVHTADGRLIARYWDRTLLRYLKD